MGQGARTPSSAEKETRGDEGAGGCRPCMIQRVHSRVEFYLRWVAEREGVAARRVEEREGVAGALEWDVDRVAALVREEDPVAALLREGVAGALDRVTALVRDEDPVVALLREGACTGVALEARLEEVGVAAGDCAATLAVFAMTMTPEVVAGVAPMYAAVAFTSIALKFVVVGLPYTGSGMPRGTCSRTPQRTVQMPL